MRIRKRLTGQRNQCAGCSEFFATNSLFAKHRIGEFGKDRRCMTVEEMTALEWRKVDDFWRGKPADVQWWAA